MDRRTFVSMVAAGSVVTRDLPDRAIAVGVPAKVLRFRSAAPTGGSEPPVPAGSAHDNGQRPFDSDV